MRKWQTIKEYEDIKFDFFEGIAKITINRPRVYNAFRPQTNKEMLDAMTICRERNDIGVVVLTGAGDKMCIRDRIWGIRDSSNTCLPVTGFLPLLAIVQPAIANCLVVTPIEQCRV